MTGMVRSVYTNSSDLSASKQLLKTLSCNTLYDKPLKLKKEVAKQAEHLGTPIAHIHKLKKPRKCIIFRTVIVLSRDKQDLTI